MSSAPSPIQKDYFKNPDIDSHKIYLIEQVLHDTNRENQFSDWKDAQVSIYFQSVVTSNQDDAIISIQFDAKNTIIAIYSPLEETFLFTVELGRFYHIKEISFIPSANQNLKMIALLEEINMQIGAYENTIFLKCYLWDNSLFRLVLNVPKDINSYWNTVWFEQNEKNYWCKVALKGTPQWGHGSSPVLYLYEIQEYSVSTEKKQSVLPNESTFNIINDRFLVEKFYWDEKWNRFILIEKINLITGNPVAVIQDIEMSPYSLVDGPIEKSIISSQDNVISMIDKKHLKNI